MTNQSAADDPAPIVNIIGDLVALGPPRRDLLPLYERWINDFSTLRTLGLPPGAMTTEREMTWFESVANDPNGTHFVIYERATMRPIGNTGLYEVNHRHRTATFGIMIGEPDARGKGYGTESARLMLDFGFNALGLNNIWLTVYEFNWAGQHAYAKAGFKEIGRRRQARFMGGRFWDEIYMDCLASEFTSPVLAQILRPDERRES